MRPRLRSTRLTTAALLLVVLSVCLTMWYSMRVMMPTVKAFGHNRLDFHLEGTLPATMADLATWLAKRPNRAAAVANVIDIRTDTAVQRVPQNIAAHAREMFARHPDVMKGMSSMDFIERQKITRVRNVVTEEYAVFNILRRYRPGYTDHNHPAEERRVIDVYDNGTATCDFCRGRTAEEIFGKVQGGFCVVASNIAKWDRWHGLLIGSSHNPIGFTATAVQDYVETAHRWHREVLQHDPSALMGTILWDVGSKASASQVHLHMHINAGTDLPGRMATTVRSAASFNDRFGANYFDALISAHDAVGLAIWDGPCAVLAYLTPTKEKEVMVLAPPHSVSQFGRAVGNVLEILRDKLSVRSFSLGMWLDVPQVLTDKCHQLRLDDELCRLLQAKAIPLMARVVDRGNLFDKRNDVGSMELFMGSNVAFDPYDLAAALRSHLKK